MFGLELPHRRVGGLFDIRPAAEAAAGGVCLTGKQLEVRRAGRALEAEACHLRITQCHVHRCGS